MAFVFTYDGLVSELQLYTQRSDANFVNRIPTFITLAQDRISKDLEILGAVRYATGTMVPNVAIIQKPSLWLNNATFTIGTGLNFETRKMLSLRVYESSQLYAPDRTEVGEPKFYSDYDSNHWLISPTPDLAYPLEIAYFQRFYPLDSTNQTNWLTENDPETLFLQLQLQACAFTKNWSDYQNIKPVYVEAVSSLVTRDKSRQTDRYSKRDKD